VTLAVSIVTSCAFMEIEGAVAGDVIVGCELLAVAVNAAAVGSEAFTCGSEAACDGAEANSGAGAIGLVLAFELIDRLADESTAAATAGGWLTEAN